MPDGLADHPFAYVVRGSEILVTHRSRPAVTLRGAVATSFLERVASLDDDEAQQLMARVTGNFKRGNEHRG